MSLSSRSFRLFQIAEALGGTVEGDPDCLISLPTAIADAIPGSVVRVENPRYLAAAEASAAAAILTGEKIGPFTKPCVRVPQVRLAWAQLLELFAPERRIEPGIHPTAVVGPRCEIDATAAIGPYAVLGAGVRVGPAAVVHSHAVLQDEVEVGAGSEVFPHAVLYPGTVLGERVRIHSGVVLGADGFGYEWDGRRHYKIPQLGRVRVEDDVEIGANTTIDRATTGETVIGAGTKIDNQVQVAHNVRTGRHCLLVSQVGVAGSAILGNGVVLAGQAGVKDHITLGDGVQVAGGSGVWGDQPPGVVLSGNPAQPHRQEVRTLAAVRQVPDLIKKVRELERRLEQLQGDTAGDA